MLRLYEVNGDMKSPIPQLLLLLLFIHGAGCESSQTPERTRLISLACKRLTTAQREPRLSVVRALHASTDCENKPQDCRNRQGGREGSRKPWHQVTDTCNT